jgi:hypothetical protein
MSSHVSPPGRGVTRHVRESTRDPAAPGISARHRDRSPASLRGSGSNLPAAVSPIGSRRLELAVLGPLLRAEPLLTLTGVGGIGKTRLAVELAVDAVGPPEVGPFYVDLAQIADAVLAPRALATALEVRVNPPDDPMAVVRSALASRAAVILIDNCEHLLPEIADVVGALPASHRGLRVLATSREPLGGPGDRVCPADPLPQLADRLDRSISELAPSPHGVVPQHWTMRAAARPGVRDAVTVRSVSANGDGRVCRWMRPRLVHGRLRRRSTATPPRKRPRARSSAADRTTTSSCG